MKRAYEINREKRLYSLANFYLKTGDTAKRNRCYGLLRVFWARLEDKEWDKTLGECVTGMDHPNYFNGGK